MKRPLPFVCALLALSVPLAAHADPALDSFARDLDRTESVRAVKTLQRTFSQYAQEGLWTQAGLLFAPKGQFTFDGSVKEAIVSTGPAAVAAFLRNRYGGGHEGKSADGLSTILTEAGVVNLAPDGNSAKIRWETMILHGHGGNARIEGRRLRE